MATWGYAEPEFSWVWAILRWKLGDAEIQRVLAENNIEYESDAFRALGAEELAALFPKENYPDVTWCQYGQFSRYGQLKELGPEAETIRLINAIGDVSPQSGPAIAAARAAYDALDAETKAKVTNYDVLLAAEATFAGLAQITDAETVRNGIMATLASDPTAIGVRSVNGEWKLLALARDGRITSSSEMAQNYLLLLDKALERNDGTLESVTDYARVALALSSLGISADSFRYAEESTVYDLTESYAAYSTDMLLNQTAYALLALNAKPYTQETDSFVNALVGAALENGGWNLNGAGDADADMTAMVIQALAPYYGTNDAVKTAIDRGLAVLKDMQDQTGGGFYGMGQYNSCSVAQVIVALCSLGIDPTGEEWSVGENGQYNPVTALCQFYIADEDNSSKGMIKYTLNASRGDEMSTEQAAYALAAYNRLKNDQDTLYDMSALFTTSEANEAVLTELKALLESADWTLAQADAPDEEKAKAAFEALLAEKIPSGVKAEVTEFSFTAAAEGTRENEKGENGKYSATVTLEKGENETHALVTAAITDAVITATEYFASEDEQALDALKTALEGMDWTLDQADAEDDTAAKAAVVAKLTEELLNGASAEVTISSFEAAITGTAEDQDGTNGNYEATIVLSKGEATLTVTVTGAITAAAYVDPSSQITVTFRLIGAYPATQPVQLNKNLEDYSSYMPEYVTWIPSRTYTISKASSMYDLFTMALTDAGLTSVGAEDGYVKSITAPAALTGYRLSEKMNGPNSGWMYTVNGKHPGVGLKTYYFDEHLSEFENGQVDVVWHYINDYTCEQSDVNGGSAGDESIWDTWLDAAPDVPAALETSVASGESASVSIGSFNSTVSGHGADAVTATKNEDDILSFTMNIGDTTVTLQGQSALTLGMITYEITSSGVDENNNAVEPPCIVLVKNADGKYIQQEIKTDKNGVHTLKLAVGQEIVVALKGDVNGDGVINGSDLNRINALILGADNVDRLSDVEKMVADVVYDGYYNASDLNRVNAHFLGNKAALTW